MFTFMRRYRDLGYSSHDIITTMFKVTKSLPTLPEHIKLEFIKVIMPLEKKNPLLAITFVPIVRSRTNINPSKEIGFTHMRILEGVQTLLQLSGCVARLCKLNMKPSLFEPRA